MLHNSIYNTSQCTTYIIPYSPPLCINLHNSTYQTSKAIIPHLVKLAKNMVHNSTYRTSHNIRYIIQCLGSFIYRTCCTTVHTIHHSASHALFCILLHCVSTMQHSSTYQTSQSIIPHLVKLAKNMVHNSTYSTSHNIRYIIQC